MHLFDVSVCMNPVPSSILDKSKTVGSSWINLFTWSIRFSKYVVALCIISFRFVSWQKKQFLVCSHLRMNNPLTELTLYVSKLYYIKKVIAWKVSVFGVFVVRIFPHSDQENFEYGHLSRSGLTWLHLRKP